MKLSQLATYIKLAKELGITIVTVSDLGRIQQQLKLLMENNNGNF